MVMTIEPNGQGGLIVSQRLRSPVIYLDHWAVRLFSSDRGLQDEFIDALHRSGGTWLFSNLNLMEFIAMIDLDQAAAAEDLLLRAIPHLHVSDIVIDPGYLLDAGAPPHPDAPDDHWMFNAIVDHVVLAGGHWDLHNFIADFITHRQELLPIFDEMKQSFAESIAAERLLPEKVTMARRFVPNSGMEPRLALARQLLREIFINPAYRFETNDAMDLIHTLAPAQVADFALLDIQWCHRLENAIQHLRNGGVTGGLPKPYSRRTVPEFLVDLRRLGQGVDQDFRVRVNRPP
jgi:hypothetical protein